MGINYRYARAKRYACQHTGCDNEALVLSRMCSTYEPPPHLLSVPSVHNCCGDHETEIGR